MLLHVLNVEDVPSIRKDSKTLEGFFGYNALIERSDAEKGNLGVFEGMCPWAIIPEDMQELVKLLESDGVWVFFSVEESLEYIKRRSYVGEG